MTPYKDQAKRLKTYLKTNHDIALKHSDALHAIAAIHGFRNWQTALAETESKTEQGKVLIPEISSQPLNPILLIRNPSEKPGDLMKRITNKKLASEEALQALSAAHKKFGTDAFSDGNTVFCRFGDYVAEIDIEDLRVSPKEMPNRMGLWSVIHYHRFGNSFHLLAMPEAPSTDEAIEKLGLDFEKDREDEYLEIGPIDLPQEAYDWILNRKPKTGPQPDTEGLQDLIEEFQDWTEGDLQAAKNQGAETQFLEERLNRIAELGQRKKRPAQSVVLNLSDHEQITIEDGKLTSSIERRPQFDLFNGFADGIESLLLALHSAGVDLSHKRTQDAVQTAFEAFGNHHE